MPERPLHGRGTSTNPPNRYEALHVEPDDPASGDDRTVYYRDASRSILAENDSPDVGFRYSLNPYRGCAHGCSYCYARPTHEYLGFSAGLDFERRIMVKEDAPTLLRQAFVSPRWTPQLVALSGNTDCYQPVERRLGITRRCLEVFVEFRNPVGVVTKSALVARDVDLLRLMRAARFSWVFIGIETTDEASLKETRKTQNVGGDILADVRRLYAHGIDVLAGFIIGFDNDTLATFDRQREFVMAAGIQSAMIGLLQAMPRTPLHERLQKEGRLRPLAGDSDNTVAGTNVMPKSMDYDTMVERFRLLYRELLTDGAIGERIRNKMRHLRQPVYAGGFGIIDSLRIIGRLVRRGVLPGGPSRWAAFLRSLPLLRPTQFPSVVSDWIIGLSMADFARRRLGGSAATRLSARRVAAIRLAMAHYIEAGLARLEVEATPTPSISLELHGPLGRRFFARAARSLDRLLKDTHSTVTLRIQALRGADGRHLERLLHRLRRHGDRVSVDLDERLRSVVSIDSSVFHLMLTGSTESAARACGFGSRMAGASTADESVSVA